MSEEIVVKRKRGRPRKVVVDEPPKRAPRVQPSPERGKHKFSPGDIAGYSTADMNYQFKVLRRVETHDAPAWIWGSTQGNGEVDMVIQEAECVLLRGWV